MKLKPFRGFNPAEAYRRHGARYPTIKVVRAGENFTILKLVADGNCGVGEQQAQACRGCAKYGAAISAIPGSIGKVYRNQCFDPACNTAKVAERIKAEKAEKAAAVEGIKADKGGNTKSASKTPAATKKAASSAKTSVVISQRVKDYRVTVWRKMFKLEAQRPEFNVVLLLTLALTGRLSKAGHTALSKAFTALTQNEVNSLMLGTTAALVAAADVELQTRLVHGIAASCFESLEERDIVSLLDFMQADLGAHWVLNAEYLELLTKSEIQNVAEQLGIAAHLGDKMPKIMAGKKDEIIKALLAIEDFDYKGKVPAHLKYERKD